MPGLELPGASAIPHGSGGAIWLIAVFLRLGRESSLPCRICLGSRGSPPQACRINRGRTLARGVRFLICRCRCFARRAAEAAVIAAPMRKTGVPRTSGNGAGHIRERFRTTLLASQAAAELRQRRRHSTSALLDCGRESHREDAEAGKSPTHVRNSSRVQLLVHSNRTSERCGSHGDGRGYLSRISPQSTRLQTHNILLLDFT